MKAFKTAKHLKSILSIIIVLILLLKIQANQCTDQQNGTSVHKLQYSRSDGGDDLYPFSIEYDTETEDFFYFGRGSLINENFITRRNKNGNEVWTQIFDNILVRRSLMYSSINEAIYVSASENTTFSLIKMNSTNGGNLQNFKGGTVYQRYDYHSCSLSNDESIIFCNGQKSNEDSSLAIIKFNISSSVVNIINYPSNYRAYNTDLIVLSNNEICFQTYSLGFGIDYIKARFNTSTELYEERFHTRTGGSEYDSCRSAVDEETQTIWNVREYYDAGMYYSQHNIDDFSIVGSMYRANFTSNGFYAYDCNILDRVVYFSIRSDSYYEFYKINSTTQDMIMIYRADPENSFYYKALLIANGHINIVSGYYDGTRDNINHIKIPSTQDSNIPNYSQVNDRGFSATNSYDISDTTILSYVFTDLIILNNTLTSTDTSVIEINSENSFQLLINDNDDYEYSFTFTPEQVHTYNIDLPCELDTFDTSLRFDQSGTQQLPDWVEFNENDFTITFTAPTVFENTEYSFTIGVSVADYNLVMNYVVTVVPCHEKCENCKDGICQECQRGYDLSDDNLACEFTDLDSYDIGIFDSQITFIVLKISVGINTAINLIVRIISGNSDREEWLIIHMMQQLVMLPLMAKFMTNQVRHFILDNVYFSFSIYVISLDWKVFVPFSEELSFDQFNDYFKTLKWESGSTLVNNLILIGLIFAIIFLHLLIWLLRRLSKSWSGWLHGIFCKLFDFFTFSVYIRIFYESYFFVLLMAVSEINFYNKISQGDYISQHYWNLTEGSENSIICTYIICVLIFCFLLFVILSWCCNLKTINVNKNCFTKELYVGCRKFPLNFDPKNSCSKYASHEESIISLRSKVKIARLYPSLFLYRRTCMVFILVFIEDFETKIYSLIAMQVLRVNYSYWIKSFTLEKDQIIEISNEVIYLILMVLLTQFTDYDKWTKFATSIYAGIILSYTCVLLVLSIHTFMKVILESGVVKRLFKKLKICRTKDSQRNKYQAESNLNRPSRQEFSEISFSIQHKQDSIRVEKMYSFDSVEDQNFKRHASHCF